MGGLDLIVPVASVGDRLPLLRPEPCECGELPVLIDGVYLCTCPGCPCYGEEAWEPPLV
jgi:hypothetical protein